MTRQNVNSDWDTTQAISDEDQVSIVKSVSWPEPRPW